MSAAPGSDIGHSATQPGQRSQADADLEPRRKGQDAAEKDERDREIFGECGCCRRHPCEVFSYGQANDDWLAGDRKCDGALGHQHALVPWAGRFMLVGFAGPQPIDREFHRRVPQGARAQKLPPVITDLPVKPRKRISEAGIDRRLRQHQFAWRIDVDAGKELLQMNVEILRERARNMPFEDEDERAPSDRQSDQDRDECRRRRAAA